jgi:hypothetical protein
VNVYWSVALGLIGFAVVVVALFTAFVVMARSVEKRGEK